MNHLTEGLKDDYSFIVYTSAFDAEPGVTEFNGAELKIIPLRANGVQSIPYDIVSMIHAIYKRYDVLLILGTSGCLFLPVVSLFHKSTILNIDGAEWKRGKWGTGARLFLRQSEKMGVKYANVVIADNKIIQDHVRTTYGVNAELIEYGGDNARYIAMSAQTQKRYGIKTNQYAFKVCRIEPENNIDLILEAFSQSKLQLMLVGNWANSSYGKGLRLQFEKYSNLILLDPIYEQSQLDELRSNCCVYVHGHSVGGTNPSLVEAMNLGLFCVVFKVSYNLETTEERALYFSSTQELLSILNQYQAGKIDSVDYKAAMKQIATRRYSWQLIVTKYKRLLSGEG
jgi:glycosyltransferase involved in cell wall biosynthesis